MTTKTDIALTDRLTIIKLLATGKSLEFAATVTKIKMPAVQILAEDFGYPDTAKLTWAADLITEEIAAERRMTITNHPRCHDCLDPPPGPTGQDLAQHGTRTRSVAVLEERSACPTPRLANWAEDRPERPQSCA